MTTESKEAERMVNQRDSLEGLNVSPPGPSNMRPSVPPTPPPKAPAK